MAGIFIFTYAATFRNISCTFSHMSCSIECWNRWNTKPVSSVCISLGAVQVQVLCMWMWSNVFNRMANTNESTSAVQHDAVVNYEEWIIKKCVTADLNHVNYNQFLSSTLGHRGRVYCQSCNGSVRSRTAPPTRFSTGGRRQTCPRVLGL